jgi:hypothetical protein
LGAFGIRRLGLLVGALRVLLGLGRILLAFDMVVLAMRLGGDTMGLCRRFVMFRRLVVRVFHLILLLAKISAADRAASIVAE